MVQEWKFESPRPPAVRLPIISPCDTWSGSVRVCMFPCSYTCGDVPSFFGGGRFDFWGHFCRSLMSERDFEFQFFSPRFMIRINVKLELG